MLKEAALTKIAGLLKIDAAKLKAAIADEKETDVEIAEDLTVFNKAELKLRDDNQYGNGKKAGEEMLIKGLKTKHSIEFSGEDPDKLVEAIQKKVKAEVETNPDARIVELNKTLETTKRHLREANEKADGFQAQIGQIQSDTELLALFPNNRLDLLSNGEYLNLIKPLVKIETRDGRKVTLKNGEIMTDPKTGEPISPDQVINGIFAEKKWIKEAEPTKPIGRGGGNSQLHGLNGKFMKVSELKKQLDDEGVNINGEEYTKRIQAAKKENPDMDMNS